MIIFGFTTRQKEIDRGQFVCPACRANTSYALKRVAKYFHVYFIPLFATSELGRIVTCGACGRQFHEDVVRGAHGD